MEYPNEEKNYYTSQKISKNSLTGHKDQIISVSPFTDTNGNRDPNVFVSNSEDSTIRVWDLRTQNTVMLFKIPESLNQISGNIF